MKSNKLSIIVPIYNGEKYIHRCVDSLLKQSYDNLEILLINDGSTDNTDAICKKYENNVIKYYRKENTGVSDTRNFGIIKSTGTYITFMDVDDWIDNDAFKNCMNLINSEDLDILKFSYVKDYGKYQKKYVYHVETNIKILKNKYDMYIKDYIFSTYDLSNVWNAIFKKDIIDKFDKNIKYGEDFKFMIDALSNSNSIYFINDCYYHYMYNDNSETNDIKIDKLKMKFFDTLVVIQHILKLYDNDTETFDQAKNRVLSTANSIMLQVSFLKYHLYKKLADDIECMPKKFGIEINLNKGIFKYLILKLNICVKILVKSILK